MKSEQIGEIETCVIPEKGAPRGRYGRSYPGIWGKAINELATSKDGAAVSLRVKTGKVFTGAMSLRNAAKRAGIRINTRTDREPDGVVKYTVWRRNGEPK